MQVYLKTEVHLFILISCDILKILDLQRNAELKNHKVW